MLLIKSDFIPYLADAGLDATIRSLLGRQTDLQVLTANINQQISEGLRLALSSDEVLTYIGERQQVGVFTDIKPDSGNFPAASTRPEAPTGLGQNEAAIWFSAPASDTRVIRWYVNGTLMIEKSTDCAADRSMLKSVLGCKIGDVVQLAEVSGGVVGWWVRITIE